MTMEEIDGGLHPAVDGQSLDEDERKTKMEQMTQINGHFHEIC